MTPDPHTLSVRGRRVSGRQNGPVVAPIVQSAMFESVDIEAYRRSKSSHAYYTREGNPTITEAEDALAGLEGAERALVFASGMAAITTSLLAVLKPGDHMVAQRELFYGTFAFMRDWLPRLGIECTFVPARDTAAMIAEIRSSTRVVYLETPANPLLRLVDLAAITAGARAVRPLVVVDNTFATPINQRPLELGADLVLHSATKYLSGHSDLLAGAVAGRAEILTSIHAARTHFGGVMDPHAAWLLRRGIKTLALRVERQNQSALQIAAGLERHPAVAVVHYPFLPSHPQHELARRQMAGGGGVVTFELKGGWQAAHRFVNSLELVRLAGSLGGVETLVSLPAVTTEGGLSDAERETLGITSGLVRVAVGVEGVEAIMSDIDRSLESLGMTEEGRDDC